MIPLVSNLFRSPGGTPLHSKENTECGSGLTPIMTQALRRKFQASHGVSVLGTINFKIHRSSC